MKKLVFLPVLLGLSLLWSCEEVTVPNTTTGTPTTNYYYNNNGNGIETFNWIGCNPEAPIALGRSLVVGYNNVYDNYFKIYLGGSLVDPNPLYMATFSIPHVGPGGQMLYVNVANDATYTITAISGGYVFYTIRCIEGSVLKYNIAKYDGTKWCWFLRYGLPYDDGINNIYTITL